MTQPFFSLMRAYFPVHEAENEGPVTARARVCMRRLTLRGTGMLFISATHTDILHIHKQTHTVAAASFAGRRQKFTETHTGTHIPCNKGPTVSAGKMNCLYCIIRVTHQTVINENRMKVLIKGEKCRHEECLPTKR